jgi:hypothetical protein
MRAFLRILACVRAGQHLTGGAGGIRTLDRALQPYNGLANRRLQPLGHSSVKADMPDAGASRKRQICRRSIPVRASCSWNATEALARICGGDAGRSRELESLLCVVDHVRNFLRDAARSRRIGIAFRALKIRLSVIHQNRWTRCRCCVRDQTDDAR